MDVHIIVKLKSSYEAWHQLFIDDADRRSQVCDESRTLVAKASETTAVVTVFDVDMEKMGAMMAAPEFQRMIEPYVEEHISYSLAPLLSPS